MVTPAAALELLGEDTASEMLEKSFDLLTVAQRRFLVARIELDTDAAALRRSHSVSSTLENWRSSGVAFEKIYLAAKRSTPAEVASISQMRFGYIAGTALTVIEEFFAESISEVQIETGLWAEKRLRAKFALDVIKEIRSRGRVAARANEKSSPSSPSATSVLELTQEAMTVNGKDD